MVTLESLTKASTTNPEAVASELPSVAIELPGEISRVLAQIRKRKELSRIVVFDLHGTLADPVEAFCQATGNTYNPEYINLHPLMEHTDNCLNAKVINFLSDPQFIPLLQPYPDSLDAVRRIAEAGLIPAIVSGSPPRIHEATREWLFEHGFLEYIEISYVLQREATVGKTTDYKQSINELLWPFAVLDDQAKMAVRLSKAGITTFHITHGLSTDYTLFINSEEGEKAIREKDLEFIFPTSTLSTAVDKIIDMRDKISQVILPDWDQ